MFFQLVIDKVLSHQSVTTLWVLAVGIIIALASTPLLGFLRQMLTMAASNKIDMRLTRRTFAPPAVAADRLLRDHHAPASSRATCSSWKRSATS
jgi:ABC-type protease/lipase transport system fused ATPase/permease subunit